MENSSGSPFSAARASSIQRTGSNSDNDTRLHHSRNEQDEGLSGLIKLVSSVKTDPFCWYCHTEVPQAEKVRCSECYRLFHVQCWDELRSLLEKSPQYASGGRRLDTCVECWGSFEEQHKMDCLTMRLGPQRTWKFFSYMINFVQDKLQKENTGPFSEASHGPECLEVVCPFALQLIRQNIANNQYATCADFLSDLRGLAHRSIVVHGANSGYTRAAKYILNTCIQLCSSMEWCDECFERAYPREMGNGLSMEPFTAAIFRAVIEPCSKLHTVACVSDRGALWPVLVMAGSKDFFYVRLFGSLEFGRIHKSSIFRLTEDFELDGPWPESLAPKQGSDQEYHKALRNCRLHIGNLLLQSRCKVNFFPSLVPFDGRLSMRDTPPDRPSVFHQSSLGPCSTEDSTPLRKRKSPEPDVQELPPCAVSQKRLATSRDIVMTASTFHPPGPKPLSEPHTDRRGLLHLPPMISTSAGKIHTVCVVRSPQSDPGPPQSNAQNSLPNSNRKSLPRRFPSLAETKKNGSTRSTSIPNSSAGLLVPKGPATDPEALSAARSIRTDSGFGGTAAMRNEVSFDDQVAEEEESLIEYQEPFTEAAGLEIDLINRSCSRTDTSLAQISCPLSQTADSRTTTTTTTTTAPRRAATDLAAAARGESVLAEQRSLAEYVISEITRIAYLQEEETKMIQMRLAQMSKELTDKITNLRDEMKQMNENRVEQMEKVTNAVVKALQARKTVGELDSALPGRTVKK